MADDMDKKNQQGNQSGQGQQGNQSGQRGQGQPQQGGQSGQSQPGQYPSKKSGQGTETDDEKDQNRGQRRAS